MYDHLQADPEFGERWQNALDTAADNLEGELLRRAVEGEGEGEQVPVYDKGKVVGHTTRTSDALLMFAIKNLQRRREQEVRKSPPLRRMFGVSGSTSRRRNSAPDAKDAGAAEAPAAPHPRRPRGRPPESGAKDRKRRRGAWRWWPRWSPLPVYARVLWRPLPA